MPENALNRRGVETKELNENVFYMVPEGLFHEILDAAIGAIEFDEIYYMERYDDVARAVENGRFDCAWEHYLSYGFYEDRLPRRILVDDDYYRSHNPDVALAIAEGSCLSCQDHFERSGFAEGRLPYLGYSLFQVD